MRSTRPYVMVMFFGLAFVGGAPAMAQAPAATPAAALPPDLSIDETKRITALNYAGMEAGVAGFSNKERLRYLTADLSDRKDAVVSLGMNNGQPLADDSVHLQKGEAVLYLRRANMNVFGVKPALVLTVDGLAFEINPKFLTSDPAGKTFPQAPRTLNAALSTAQVLALLPEGSRTQQEHTALTTKFRECKERAWAPFEKRLPSISRPGGTTLVVVKNAAYVRIEEAGQRAITAQCGSDDKFKEKQLKLRAGAIKEIDAKRAEWLKVASETL